MEDMSNHSNSKTAAHCENCGSTDAQDLDSSDGYTACCNENTCSGNGRSRYGIPSNFQTACCWAKAEELFDAAGIEIADGSYRL